MKAKTKKQMVALKAKAVRMARKELGVAKRKIVSAEKQVSAYAKKNPEKAMLIAAAIGAAVGAGIIAALKRKK